MSINTARCEARIKSTKTQIEVFEKEIRSAKSDAEIVIEQRVKRLEENTAKEGEINALVAMLGLTEKPEDQATIQTKIDGLKAEIQHNIDLNASVQDTAKLVEAEAVQSRAEPFLLDLRAVLAAQETALKRKADAYPRLLKKHLYRCKRYGVADALGRDSTKKK